MYKKWHFVGYGLIFGVKSTGLIDMETVAVSEKKAMSNIKAQIRRKSKMNNNVPIQLSGKMTQIE